MSDGNEDFGSVPSEKPDTGASNAMGGQAQVEGEETSSSESPSYAHIDEYVSTLNDDERNYLKSSLEKVQASANMDNSSIEKQFSSELESE